LWRVIDVIQAFDTFKSLHKSLQEAAAGEDVARTGEDGEDRGGPMVARIRLVEGDITAQRVDAIVNAANPLMRGGGGVDGAIHRAGGPEVLADCIRRFPTGLAVGQAGWTVAGDLPARWVIHVVGPNWNAGQRDPGLLESCYREALRVADDLGARTLTFPAVSAGIYGWPVEAAARIALGTVRTASTEVQEALFVLLGPATYAVFEAVLENLETQS
jgi:O-acetyl-ADP-ribose deacetylase (regulator of RNase III)